MAERKNKKDEALNDGEAEVTPSDKGSISSKIRKSGNPEKLVKLRNRFFYMFYRYTSLLFVSSLACFICAIIFLIVFVQKPVPPQYIKVDRDGRYIPLDSVSECKENEEVKRFMLAAIRKMYKFDYINHAEQLNQAEEFFTDKGWDKYLDDLNQTKTLLSVKENKWIVTVEPLGVPVLEKEFKEGDLKTCVVDMKAPILINYIGEKGQSRKGQIYMRIHRVSVIRSDSGLGISQVVFLEEK